MPRRRAPCRLPTIFCSHRLPEGRPYADPTYLASLAHIWWTPGPHLGALRMSPKGFSIWVRFGFDKDSRAFLNLPQACYAYRRMTDLA
jgi:hypothetical protein